MRRFEFDQTRLAAEVLRKQLLETAKIITKDIGKQKEESQTKFDCIHIPQRPVQKFAFSAMSPSGSLMFASSRIDELDA